MNAEVIQSLQKGIAHTARLTLVPSTDGEQYDDFIYVPQKYFSRIAQQYQANAVMIAIVGKHNNRVSIRYSIKSANGGWDASHEAASVPLLLEKLNAHIAVVLKSTILTINSEDSALRNAQLKLMYQQEPNDLVVLSHLAQSEIQDGNANTAILLADELRVKAQQQRDKTSEAHGYIIAANAYTTQNLYTDTESMLQQATAIFETAQYYRGLHEVQQSYARMAFAQQDYARFKQALIAAMQFAQQAQDPLLEMSDSAYLSVIANKFGAQQDRQFYLDNTESLLDKTHQSEEHYGSIYFYAGMYAETTTQAEKYYRKVLDVLPAEQNWWERNRALEHLADLLVAQSRWQEALDLFSNSEPRTAQAELMLTKIYTAQQQWNPAESHGLTAFKLANLSGQKLLALDAALALLTLYHKTHQPDREPIYKQFILNEAKEFPYWSKTNHVALEKISAAGH